MNATQDPKNYWLQTYTGRRFHPYDPDPDTICIEDIAHALSQTCRFNGHCSGFYSVAHHSVLVSSNVSESAALWGLMHDAAEAYVGDLIQPIKRGPVGRSFRPLERKVLHAIADRFNLPHEIPPEVLEADVRALVTEARDVMGGMAFPWDLGHVEPFGVRITGKYLSIEGGERIFTRRFFELGGGR